AVSGLVHPGGGAGADEFMTMGRGEGAAVFDANGKRYVDALASLWFCNLGHGRADIRAAITAQLEKLENFHTFDRFTNEPVEQLCRQLVAVAPMPEARVFLTSSGSEAVDSAIKLARIAQVRNGNPERTIIVGRHHAYHGVTYA